jgi:hypothetical protein
MDTDDDRLDDVALRAHGDDALELIRFELARDDDHRLGQVIRVLMIRATPIIALTCREVGQRRGVERRDISRAIADAISRVQVRLRRPEQLHTIERIAIGVARACIEAQPVAPATAPKLAPRTPNLRVVDGLNDGTVSRNNPEMS